MDITIHPKKLKGEISVIPSKSQAHRFLICAAFADNPTIILCSQKNKDMDATARCLRALGAKIEETQQGYVVTPAVSIPSSAELPCGESGSTLRFMLPVVGALGIDSLFHMEGRLPQRPLSPLWEEMERMGCILTRPSNNTLRCHGRLKAGKYRIDGGVSSQFITGLLLGLSLLDNESELEITGKTESAPYITLTKQAMRIFGVDPDRLGQKHFLSPGEIIVEGDWSNGAFFHCANAIGSNLNIRGLNEDSVQGDRAVLDMIDQLEKDRPIISAADIPDLIPILSIVASCKNGAVFTDIARLRLKESDRVEAVHKMLSSLGGKAEISENTLTVYPRPFTGGIVNSFSDHRIAMSAAIAATVAAGPVTILGAQCTNKSYPTFWDEYARLGGKYEQHLR